jgi:hypothetical protein
VKLGVGHERVKRKGSNDDWGAPSSADPIRRVQAAT